MLTFWGRRSSQNVQKVLWFASELGLTFDVIEVGGKFGGLDDPAFLAMNPHGHVPVLSDDRFIVWESHTILRYLAAKYGRDTFYPADPQTRSLYERWMDWSQTVLQPDFLTGVFWGYYRTPPEQRNWSLINEMVDRCAQHFGLLDRILAEHDYLTGDRLSLADIPIGSLLFRYFELDINRPPLPHLEAWYARLRTRTAYKEHVMISFEELRSRLAF